MPHICLKMMEARTEGRGMMQTTMLQDTKRLHVHFKHHFVIDSNSDHVTDVTPSTKQYQTPRDASLRHFPEVHVCILHAGLAESAPWSYSEFVGFRWVPASRSTLRYAMICLRDYNDYNIRHCFCIHYNHLKPLIAGTPRLMMSYVLCVLQSLSNRWGLFETRAMRLR